MNTQLVKSDPSNPLELEVTATTPQEMQGCQAALIAWCERKIAAMKADAAELAESFRQAVAKKWKSTVLKRHAEMATKRVIFYEKMKAALEAGYCIMPNFPIDIFAIRTDRKRPLSKWHFGTYETGSFHFLQPAAKLPAGEGEYQAANPIVTSRYNVEKKDTGQEVKNWCEHATDYGDIEFPISMAKPKIMEAVGRAMGFKIFDQFGLFAPGTGDPIITGEIVDPRNIQKNPAHQKKVTFIIAWHLNVRDL